MVTSIVVWDEVMARNEVCDKVRGLSEETSFVTRTEVCHRERVL